jgi:hypothetical protein
VRKSVSDAKEELEKVTRAVDIQGCPRFQMDTNTICLCFSKISSSLDLLLYVVKPRSAVIRLVY